MGISPIIPSIPKPFLGSRKVSDNQALDISKHLFGDAAAPALTDACLPARAHAVTIPLCLPQPNVLLLQLPPVPGSRNMNFITTHIRSGPGGQRAAGVRPGCWALGPAQPSCTPALWLLGHRDGSSSPRQSTGRVHIPPTLVSAEAVACYATWVKNVSLK